MKSSPGSPPRTRGRTGRSRAVPVAGAVLALAGLLAGCHAGGSGSGSGGAGASLTELTVAATPGVADAPLYLAESQGLFAKAGLRVRIDSETSATTELGQLAQGHADVATTDYADFFYAQSNDASLRIVADGYDAAPGVMEVLSLPGSGLTSPQQLVNRTVGTPEPQEFSYDPSVPYSLETMATQAVLLNDGVEPNQVKWRPMPAQNLVGALRSHKVDAILVTEPYVYQAEAQLGAGEVLDSLSGGTASLPLDGYFTTAAFAHKYSGALDTFRSVLEQAQAEAAAGKDVRAALASAARLSQQTADMVTLGVYPTTLNVNGIQQLDEQMCNFGMLASPVSVSGMIAG